MIKKFPRQMTERRQLLFEESFRTLRSHLLLRISRSEKIFMVTSAKPEEGKSTVAINLSHAMSSIEKKVLLVDGNLRQPTFHHIFKLPNEVGLTEVLSGSVSLSHAQQLIHSGLFLLTSGSHRDNPQELLGSEKFGEFLVDARKNFDIIILDSPPLLSVADTLLLAHRSDGVILVLKSGEVTVREAGQVREQLQLAGSKIVGCVLNYVEDSDIIVDRASLPPVSGE